MKQEQAHIDQIRTAFEKMQSREDLLHLLNEVKPLIYGEKAVPFELKQLTWYANPKLGGKRYTEFKIKKKSGAQRSIHSPVKGLKAIQKTLAYILHCVYEPHKAAMGFVRERSIVDNAKIHVGNRYVYNIDLKDFFPSIDQSRVWKCLQLKPIDLKDKVNYTFPNNIKDEKKIESLEFVDNFEQTSYAIFTDKTKALVSIKKGFKEINGEFHSIFDNDDTHQILPGWGLTEINGKPWIVDENDILGSLSYNLSRAGIADLIAKICCTELEVERKNNNGEWVKVLRNVIPQGAPTSPIISNIICQRLDYLLTGVAKRFGLKYSRYADDITFSSMHNVYQTEGEFLKELHRIVVEQGFHIKETKTRLQKDGYRKEVTGLVVNEKVNVQKHYIKQLRHWLYFWERYGYEKASILFLKKFIADKGHVKNGKPEMSNVIAGKLDYMKMVKGGDNALYLKIKERFDELTKSVDKTITIPGEVIKTFSDSNKIKITLEVNQFPEINGKLNKPINIPKDTVLPSTIIVSNSIIQSGGKGHINKNNLFPHNPIYTISFLKKFKIGDGSGFKELVHDIILSDETLHEILNKVKSHSNFIYHFKKELLSDVSYLNSAIQQEVIKLIDLFEIEGIPFYKNSQKHPFNNDSKYTTYAKQFKKKYRYGSGSEYSNLQSDIIDIFNDQRVSISSMSFMPDDRKFNIRSNFFTWQPAIFKGIRYIVQGINEHSNIKGLRSFNLSEKRIIVEVEKIQLETLSFVELRIIDCLSIAVIDSLTLLQYFQGSSPFKFDFRNLCDWIVECDFLDESSKRINLLNAPEYSKSIQTIEILPYSVGGFKHILKFYDVT